MRRFSAVCRSLCGDEQAATMVEYGIMVALIAAVCFGIIAALGLQVQALFNTTLAAF
jgi:pilus assembly protein Flp/PilA